MIITSDLTINAPPQRVWDLTIDVEKWPTMTPTMTSVERLDDGPLAVGSTARVVQPKQRPTVWTVTELEPTQLFVWQAKVASVTTTATHRLTPTAAGCRNVLQVEFSGFGSGLVRLLVGSKVLEAIETENRGFKNTAEASVPTPGD